MNREENRARNAAGRTADGGAATGGAADGGAADGGLTDGGFCLAAALLPQAHRSDLEISTDMTDQSFRVFREVLIEGYCHPPVLSKLS